LRYFVRSYVTNPTTIKAMTDIPAKTPRPMGRTDSFCPGSSNAAADDACCPTIEVLSELEAVMMTSGADVPESEGPVVVIRVEVPVDDDVVGVGVPVTVDKPLTTRPEPVKAVEDKVVKVEFVELVVVVAEGVGVKVADVKSVEDVAEVEVGPGAAVTVDKPLTLMPPVLVGLVVVVAEPVLEVDVPVTVAVKVAETEVLFPHSVPEDVPAVQAPPGPWTA